MLTHQANDCVVVGGPAHRSGPGSDVVHIGVHKDSLGLHKRPPRQVELSVLHWITHLIAHSCSAYGVRTLHVRFVGEKTISCICEDREVGVPCVNVPARYVFSKVRKVFSGKGWEVQSRTGLDGVLRTGFCLKACHGVFRKRFGRIIKKRVSFESFERFV